MHEGLTKFVLRASQRDYLRLPQITQRDYLRGIRGIACFSEGLRASQRDYYSQRDYPPGYSVEIYVTKLI